MRCIPLVWVLVFLVLGLHQERVTSRSYITHFGQPTHVTVQEKHKTQDQNFSICSGTLVELDLILSAAHCFYDERTGRVKNVSEFWVSAGKPPRHRVSPIKRIDIPERYSGSSGYYANDIALVRLPRSFVRTEEIYPIDPNWYTTVRSVEHRKLGEASRSLVADDYITYGNCSTTISTHFGGTLPDDKFCIDSMTDVNRRSEDSGSGLHDSCNAGTCLVGILSIIPHTSTGHYVTHAVFTSVSYHLNWIRAFIPEARDPTSLNTACLLPEQPTDGSFEIRSCSGDCTEGPETTVPEGRVLYYQCNEGFTFQGNGTSICKNGKWNQPQRCVKAGHITRGQLTTVNVSQPATLSCLVEGHPLSEFTWVKIDDSENSERLGDRASTSRDDKTHVAMSLNFTSVTRRDNGTYECRAIDYFGTIAGQTSLIVTEKPEVSINFTISGGADSVYLNWTVYDGNDPLTMYSIQRMKEGTNKWENCSETIGVKNSSYVARGLEKNTAYKFKITAKNSIGVSQPAISNLTKTLGKDQITEYFTEVKVDKISDTSIKIFWSPPQGEIQKSFYYYHLLAKFGDRVREASKLSMNVTEYIFHDINSGAEVEIKVSVCGFYTSQCIQSSTPRNEGIGRTLAMWSGFVGAFLIFVSMAIWMIIRKRRETSWRRERRLSAFNAAMFSHVPPRSSIQ